MPHSPVVDADIEREPPLGAHLVTARLGYLHHGIYVGDGRVVHYAGLVDGFRAGPVEEVSLATFAARRTVRQRLGREPAFSGAEIARRARSRIGEDGYSVTRNNCEHLCDWCRNGRTGEGTAPDGFWRRWLAAAVDWGIQRSRRRVLALPIGAATGASRG